VESGRPQPVPDGHTGSVEEIAACADGGTVFTKATDETLRRWDAATGKELRRAELPPADPGLGRENWFVMFDGLGRAPAGTAATLSPSGRLLAVIPDDKTVALWDVSSGKEVRRLVLPPPLHPIRVGFGPPIRQPYLVRFTDDDKMLVTAESPYTIRLWDLATGKEPRELGPAEAPEGNVNVHSLGLALSRDGGVILTGVLKGMVPVPGLDELLGLKGEEDEGFGREEAMREDPMTILRVWDTARGTLRRWEVPGHVTAAVFTPDGRALATATSTHVTLWEVATGKERFRYDGAAARLACSPRGRTLAAARGPEILLLDLRTGKELARLRGHDATVRSLAFTPDGKALVSGSADSTAVVWDGTRLAPPPRPPAEELSAARLETLWADLAGADAARAYRAITTLTASPRHAVALGERVQAAALKAAGQMGAKELRRWVADLGDGSFKVRQKAAEELTRLGEAARAALEEVLGGELSLEGRRRVGELLSRLKPIPSSGKPRPPYRPRNGGSCVRWRRWKGSARRRRAGCWGRWRRGASRGRS
jgi:WD40 repeat protein